MGHTGGQFGLHLEPVYVCGHSSINSCVSVKITSRYSGKGRENLLFHRQQDAEIGSLYARSVLSGLVHFVQMCVCVSFLGNLFSKTYVAIWFSFSEE